MKPTLLILAAGMGSRYGGCKQVDPVGPNNEILMDYSIFDAQRAGFGKIVFVITRTIEQGFKENIQSKYRNSLDVEYVFQEMDKIPSAFGVPADRKKPWGTGHAVLVAKAAINEPFAVINADDYYGANSFIVLGEFLRGIRADSPVMAMVGFPIENTLSDNGEVSRGICAVKDGNLVSIVEREKIKRLGDTIVFSSSNLETGAIQRGTLVSMNFWGFAPTVLFPLFERQFMEFMRTRAADPKAEFYLPAAVDAGIKSGECSVKMLSTDENWFGLTFSQDKPVVKDYIRKKIEAGVYPERLFK